MENFPSANTSTILPTEAGTSDTRFKKKDGKDDSREGRNWPPQWPSPLMSYEHKLNLVLIQTQEKKRKKEYNRSGRESVLFYKSYLINQYRI